MALYNANAVVSDVVWVTQYLASVESRERAVREAEANAETTKRQWTAEAKEQWIAEAKARWHGLAQARLQADAKAAWEAEVKARWTAESDAEAKAWWIARGNRRQLDYIVDQMGW
jgi:hypothetical protein